MQNYDTLPGDNLQGSGEGNFSPALSLYDQGYNVIPLQPESKVPKLTTWKEYQSKRPPREKVEQWFEGPANTAIMTGETSGILVVDLDSQDAINWYWRQFEDLPSVTPIVETSRGIHIYYKLPKDLIRFSKVQPREDVEIMGGKHYVVAPPSIHPSGKQYRWLNTPGVGLKNPPKWLIRQIKIGVGLAGLGMGTPEAPETAGNSPKGKIEIDVADLESRKIYQEAGSKDDIFNHDAFNGPAKSNSTNGRFLTLGITAMNLGLDQQETVKLVSNKYPQLNQRSVKDSISAIYKNEYGLNVGRMVDLGIPKPQAIDLLSEVVSRTKWRTKQGKGIHQSREEFDNRIFGATLGLTLAGIQSSTYGELAELAGVSRSTLAHKDSEDLPDLVEIEAMNGKGIKIRNYFLIYLTILINIISQLPTMTTTTENTYAKPLCSIAVNGCGGFGLPQGNTLEMETIERNERGPP